MQRLIKRRLLLLNEIHFRSEDLERVQNLLVVRDSVVIVVCLASTKLEEPHCFYRLYYKKWMTRATNTRSYPTQRTSFTSTALNTRKTNLMTSWKGIRSIPIIPMITQSQCYDPMEVLSWDIVAQILGIYTISAPTRSFFRAITEKSKTCYRTRDSSARPIITSASQKNTTLQV